MAPVIVQPPVPSLIQCDACKAIISYLPEDVETSRWREYDGSPGGKSVVKCPRPNCPGYGVLATW